jgi:hypothetical protein
MSNISPLGRGVTFRDDFGSVPPLWRLVLGALIRPAKVPLMLKDIRDRRRRAMPRGSPDLSDHLRRDIGMPPRPEHERRWPYF